MNNFCLRFAAIGSDRSVELMIAIGAMRGESIIDSVNRLSKIEGFAAGIDASEIEYILDFHRFGVSVDTDAIDHARNGRFGAFFHNRFEIFHFFRCTGCHFFGGSFVLFLRDLRNVDNLGKVDEEFAIDLCELFGDCYDGPSEYRRRRKFCHNVKRGIDLRFDMIDSMYERCRNTCYRLCRDRGV